MVNSEKKYNILLVEDNKLNQAVIDFTLKRYGYSINIANDGNEAVVMYRNSTYDFILMDIMMPEKDGLEATMDIRSLEIATELKPVPIIAITADVMTATEERCLAAGMNGYMNKPFDINTLFTILSQLNI